MKLPHVTYEQAKKLAYMGFMWETALLYRDTDDGPILEKTGIMEGQVAWNPHNHYHAYRCPTVALVFQWLREQNIQVSIINRRWSISGKERVRDNIVRGWTETSAGEFLTYEEAELNALDKVLEKLET